MLLLAGLMLLLIVFGSLSWRAVAADPRCRRGARMSSKKAVRRTERPSRLGGIPSLLFRGWQRTSTLFLALGFPFFDPNFNCLPLISFSHKSYSPSSARTQNLYRFSQTRCEDF